MKPCTPDEATHIYMVFPTKMHSNRMLPVIRKGTREGTGKWSWNGDTENVTLKPSILMRGTNELNDEDMESVAAGTYTPVPYICHVFVNDGKVQFLNDCTHELKGQTVALLEVD